MAWIQRLSVLTGSKGSKNLRPLHAPLTAQALGSVLTAGDLAVDEISESSRPPRRQEKDVAVGPGTPNGPREISRRFAPRLGGDDNGAKRGRRLRPALALETLVVDEIIRPAGPRATSVSGLRGARACTIAGRRPTPPRRRCLSDPGRPLVIPRRQKRLQLLAGILQLRCLQRAWCQVDGLHARQLFACRDRAMVGKLTRGDEDASLHRADGIIKGIDRRAQPASTRMCGASGPKDQRLRPSSRRSQSMTRRRDDWIGELAEVPVPIGVVRPRGDPELGDAEGEQVPCGAARVRCCAA
jgi:hypothetical protein